MKWVALIAALTATIPLATWLRRNPNATPLIWMLVGFLPFFLHFFHLYMSVIYFSDWPGYIIGVAPRPTDNPGWPGYVEGAEVSILDIIILALFLVLPRAGHPVPFRYSMALYFLAVLLSTFQAKVPETALFYSWQLARMYFVYFVVVRASVDPRVGPSILKGMGAALIVQACVVIWQRYGLGIFRTPGTLSQENLLGLMSEFVLFPFFALFVAKRSGWLALVVTLAGCLVTLMTVSRGAIVLAGIGIVVTFALFATWNWTSRKTAILLFGGAMFLVAASLALLSIEKRDVALTADLERTILNKEAAAILADHPLGVGANQYVVVTNEGYRQEAAQYRRQIGLGSTVYYVIVHNAYMLAAAETGYPGLITFILLLARPLIVAFRCGWRNRGDERADILLGLTVAFLIVYIHCYFEWVFLTFEPQYMFALQLGLVAGLAQQLGYWRRSVRKKAFVRYAQIPQ